MALIVFEDDDLLVIDKPAGWNTHAPGPFAGEGVYDWLKHREPRWSSLAIIHRLDKDTSGLMVFGKSALANRSLTAQFAARTIVKKYLLVTDRVVKPPGFSAKSTMVRSGDKYVSRPLPRGGDAAETHFRVIGKIDAPFAGVARGAAWTLVEARPVTGRTHQIRVHAADNGCTIVGDTLYGGTPASRVFLHAVELQFAHPVSSEPLTFRREPEWSAPRAQLRAGIIDPAETTAFRMVHGASDGWPRRYVDRLGAFLLSQSADALRGADREDLRALMEQFRLRGAYHKVLSRHVRRAAPDATSPQRLCGEAAPERFLIRENNLSFELSFAEGYSVGLFLDQRDNRRRLLTGHVAAGFPLFAPVPGDVEVLNAFSYTCAFSVAAAKAGARVTSLDLSKKYLEWGKRNFALNGLETTSHEFIYGDAFDWMRRLARKGRQFDLIILDPPTFSQSKESRFSAERDFGALVSAALPLLKAGGVVFSSTNAARLAPEKFLEMIRNAVVRSSRRVVQQHYVPQPPDFPISRDEPAFLKAVWMRVSAA